MIVFLSFFTLSPSISLPLALSLSSFCSFFSFLFSLINCDPLKRCVRFYYSFQRAKNWYAQYHTRMVAIDRCLCVCLCHHQSNISDHKRLIKKTTIDTDTKSQAKHQPLLYVFVFVSRCRIVLEDPNFLVSYVTIYLRIFFFSWHQTRSPNFSCHRE